jgi:hypothetical protein
LDFATIIPTPNLEGQVSVFMSPSDRVAKIYPEAPGYLFVTFYSSQGYGGGILTCLHMGDPRYNVTFFCTTFPQNIFHSDRYSEVTLEMHVGFM